MSDRRYLPDYNDSDLTTIGYYRIYYCRNHPPSGPHAEIHELAAATELYGYPPDGYIVWYDPDSGVSNIPSLNPDDLVPELDNEYLVRWEIDVSATTPRLAAIEAMNTMTRDGSIAHVFDVFRDGVTSVTSKGHERIDLDEEPPTEEELAQ